MEGLMEGEEEGEGVLKLFSTMDWWKDGFEDGL